MGLGAENTITPKGPWTFEPQPNHKPLGPRERIPCYCTTEIWAQGSHMPHSHMLYHHTNALGATIH